MCLRAGVSSSKYVVHQYTCGNLSPRGQVSLRMWLNDPSKIKSAPTAARALCSKHVHGMVQTPGALLAPHCTHIALPAHPARLLVVYHVDAYQLQLPEPMYHWGRSVRSGYSPKGTLHHIPLVLRGS
jgi:hypothetical protein